MSNLINPSARPTATVDVSTANVAAEPETVKVDGVSQETESKSDSGRSYTAEEVQLIVKDRLAREQKKFAKASEKQNAGVSHLHASQVTAQPTKPVSTNIEEEWRQKLTEYETKAKTLEGELSTYKEKALTAEITRTLDKNGCLDSELVVSDLKARKLVGLDDDGNVVVDNLANSLDDLVKDYLAKKPHLVRAQQMSGVGSKAPKNIAATKGTPGSFSREELEAQLNIAQKPKFSFGR